jgi:hypothetical protein
MTAQLSPLGVQKFYDNNGNPLSFGLLYSYAAGTTNPQSTYVDSTQTTQNTNPIQLNFRGECNLWLDPTLTYKLLLTDSVGNTIPNWPVDNIPGGPFITPSGSITIPVSLIPNPTNTLNLGNSTHSWANIYVGTNLFIGSGAIPLLDSVSGDIGYYARTIAEVSAAVTPTNFYFPPGDLRRYSSFLTGGGDVTTALQNDCAQAQKSGGSPVYIPGAMGSLTVTAGVAMITSAITVYGDGRENSVISTANDITIFSVSLGGSSIPGCVFRDFNLQGKATGGPTNPAILFTNTPYNTVSGMRIQSFGVGVRYAPGANSSYLNRIINSDISQNVSINIDAQKLTNKLDIIGVTFGGGATATGLKVTDSSAVYVCGYDCEGCTLVGIDIDNPTINNLGGHEILGGEIEGATSTFSAGCIRLGASNVSPVVGVHISGIMSASGGTDDSLLNAINCNGVEISNVFLNSGFAGSSLIDACIRIGANAKNISWKNIQTAAGTLAGGSTSFGLQADGQSPATGAAVATGNGGLIATANLTVSRVSPAGAITAVVLQAGTRPGQRCTVINEAIAANTITFAAAGTSNVADGTSDQIAGLISREFVWDTVTSLWYRKG